MKALFLSIVALLGCAGTVSAQYNYALPPMYSWEVGINGGLSVATRPTGPAEVYQGSRTDIVHDFSARIGYYFSEHWMMALDIGDRRWESFGTWTLPTTFGQSLQPRNISFLIADHALSSSIQMNYVIPFYTRYRTYTKANLYFGVLVGMVNTFNDGSIGYSRYNAAPDSSFMYTSSYNYQHGIGYSLGLQAGFTYYVVPRLGLNIELGTRYVDIGTHEQRYAHQNARYHLLYFPQTVGIRWRF
ncbi:MAG: hypothetical protein V4649_00070 [Bacteroidota bacterium]